MSSDTIVLSVNNVSKCFEMYEKPVHRLFQTLCAGHRKFYKEFWALRDISFEVRKGECVGIIGRNGAGKSTLLQIVTGTLQPTSGTMEHRGRIAALLELGSGFNPEFTGRENVRMNAAILGLSEEEINAKYDEIVEFADIGEFIDQPVKTYSSGMMVRLAFAVQIMVRPDILIIDEALAVGDAAFQRKCFLYMEKMHQSGVTFFLVSHDLETLKRFCGRVIFLDNRTVAFDGDSAVGIALYKKSLFPAAPEPAAPEPAAPEPAVPERENGGEYVLEKTYFEKTYGTGGALIPRVRVFGLEAPNLLQTPGKIRIEITASWDREMIRRQMEDKDLAPNLIVGYAMADQKDVYLFGTNTSECGVDIDPFAGESALICYDVDLPELAAGTYFLVFAMHLGRKTDLSVDLLWQDFSIELHSLNTHVRGGFIHVPTRAEVIMGG